MRWSRVNAILLILLLSQIRGRGGLSNRWLSKPTGLILVAAIVFAASSSIAYALLGVVPEPEIAYLRALSLQLLSSVPLIVLSFVVLYGIFFVIGDNAQYASSEMVNYMPISSSEYVLASSFSTVLSYCYVVTGVLGVSLALALRFGLIGAWAVSSLLAAFCSVMGGFASEIIKSIVNRVSSTFSKRGGRAAILSRAVLIVFVLALSQVFFNPGILFRVLESIAPRIQELWFVPLVWPSIVVAEASAGDFASAAFFSAVTLLFGGALMLSAVAVRSRYWVPVPVTIRISHSGHGEPGKGSGLKTGFGSLLFTQAELAVISKDIRSLARRKEMVRFWSIPIIMMMPLFLTMGSMDRYEVYGYAGMFSLMGTGIFGLFLSAMSIGQEGKALWRIFASPIGPESYFKAKAILPLSLSLVLSLVFSGVFSLVFNFGPNAAASLLVLSTAMACISVSVGLYFGSIYPELSEKPRGSYISGTGILLSMLVLGVAGLISASPVISYIFMGVGYGLFPSLAVSLASGLIISFIFFTLSKRQFQKFFAELPA
ncbi:MAG: hypothetical protein ACO0C9_03940 [Candidatus Methanosuratincola verstraetei]|jgi:hypothetical protein|uniref:Uncharacterized protein n=1 Tax=Methanosuratincola subterraneus TaxID=2593994 RepID=A0A444L747_METS7|nr:MAG: hypothetical protein Metus_1376 [Candidatus Methanosuratincola subterraneus]